VDAEQGIAFCIRQIRSVLGDNSASPRYIETIPRQGFRFVGNLETAPEKRVLDESASPAEPVLPSEVAAPEVPALRKSTRSRVYPWVVFGSIAAALLIVIGAIAFRLVRHTDLYTVEQVLPVTTYPGSALHPCYSPDGRQLTFSLDREGERSIYVAFPRSDHPLRLTHGSPDDDFPMWSPDGKYIAFVRFRSRYEGELMLVLALGGEERALHSVNLSYEVASSSRLLAWTPDSKWICFTTRPEKSKSREGLVLLSPETGESRPVFPVGDRNTSDSSPAFSPDGRWLAFARLTFPFNSTLLLQGLSPGLQPEGEPIEVRGAGTNPLSPVWTQDSRSLLFLDQPRLLQAEINDVKSLRPAHQIYVTSNTRLESLTFAGPEPRLCTSTFPDGSDLWAMSLRGSPAGARVPQKILVSQANQLHPEYSPDGRWLAFVSDRDGSPQVWIASAEGDHPRQLTHLPNYILGWPGWSPDGQSLSFHARAPLEAELYVVRVADGVLRQVTHGVPGIAAASWSRDGRFLYGLGSHNGTEFLFRIPLNSGVRELLWEGTLPREAPGRHLLLYSKINQHGMFARPLTERGAAEPEQKLVNDFIDEGAAEFVPDSDGFYYTASDTAGKPRAFCFYSFDSKKTVDIAPAPHDLDGGFAVSPDRGTLIYAALKSDEASLISLELKRER
jgi:Tol biopolymer transport system component